MRERFGARLRQHREERGIDLKTIADQTKIKASLLEGLEHGDISHWPAGIFRRAYVRAYAHAIGQDPDAILREFTDIYPDPVEVIETPPAPPRFRGLVGSAMGSLSKLRRQPAIARDERIPEPPRRLVPSPPVAEAPAIETQGTVGRVPAVSAPELATIEMPTIDPPAIDPPAIEPQPVEEPRGEVAMIKPEAEVDFLAAAQLCTELGRVQQASQLAPLLGEAIKILDGIGLIVWLWDDIAGELRPALAHGYSERVLAQVPGVKRDANNVTAAAFRASELRTITGREGTNAALALPLMTPAGCAGVLAVELSSSAAVSPQVEAAATVFAAMLAQLLGGAAETERRASEPVSTARASSA